MEKRTFNSSIRWLHIYLSMFSFGALLFFAATGITLNHPSWAEKKQTSELIRGVLDPSWIAGTDSSSVDGSEIVKHLRENHKIRGQLTEFSVEETNGSISFNGPGYSAYGLIERSTGSYELVVTTSGIIGTINDLHKGYETDSRWNLVIDISAIFLVVVSLTGLIMIFFITKRRTRGVLAVILGAVAFILLCLVTGL